MKNKYYYWISSALKSSLIAPIACILYGVLMCVGTKQESFADIINDTIMFYFLIISTVFVSVFTSTTIPYMTDISLSLGSTRNDAFKGANLFNTTIIVLFTVILIILGLLSNKNILEMGRCIITYTASMAIAAGIGSFGGILSMSKGAKLGLLHVISTLCSFSIPLLLMFFSGTLMIMTSKKIPATFGEKEIIVTIAAVILGIIIYALGALKMKTHFSNHEVRI